MADQAKLTVRVMSNRGSSTVSFATAGRYVRLTTGGISEQLLGQAVQPTASAKAFWLSVLALVQAELETL